jgi:hypothetical protein
VNRQLLLLLDICVESNRDYYGQTLTEVSSATATDEQGDWLLTILKYTFLPVTKMLLKIQSQLMNQLNAVQLKVSPMIRHRDSWNRSGLPQSS